MTEEVSLVFPNQLFEDNPCLNKHRRVFIIEDELFFSYQPFHKQKLVLHRASMKFYADFLMNRDYRVTYIDHNDHKNLQDFFKRDLRDENVRKIHFCNPVDDYLSGRLKTYADEYDIETVAYDSPMFLNNDKENEEALGKESDFYKMADFYRHQRKRLDILVEDGKPVNGKWSFDSDNRKSLPKDYEAPEPFIPEKNQYVSKAIDYVNEIFPDNPGILDNFIYPVTFEEARKSLKHFLNNRFDKYGPFQDAISQEHYFLNHSLISSSLNTGLLTPDYVVDEALKMRENDDIEFSSVEGFIRQVIGWREFIRAIYIRHGRKERSLNFWKNNHKLSPEQFEKVTLLKHIQEKAEKYAYAHHIERLMILGNFMLLSELHPEEVYNYFMTYYIDAYDWVMVPNVYGMSQFADGGLMATKPYISSSNYLKKMGAKLDEETEELWDALYWRFLFKNRDYFESNQRTKMMLHHLDKMKEDRLNDLLSKANEFLGQFSKR
ncbi:MAG: cryptochrome/photolyase family protein [Brumimicrobium sp.]|nr:cryptochrome/photolyase family protein [Brumimicrobium sp.]